MAFMVRIIDNWKLEIILNNDNLLKYLENVIDVNVFSRQDKETISKLNSEIF